MITHHNSIVRQAMPIGSARSDQGDVGAMHPIGAKVLYDGVTILDEYKAGNTVTYQLSRRFVRALSRIGSVVFPDVLAINQDIIEQDACVQLPPKTMAGD